VRVGEPFTLVLTCAVVDTESTTVVPDQSRLDPSVLQVAPFDVLSGTQAADVRTRTHRFFQYEYVLRFLGETIGQEVSLAGPTIAYRVQSRVQGDAAVESRERRYILPSHRIRILSLVPPEAADIHDYPPETFREIEDRRFRADLLQMAEWGLFGLGGVMVLWAVAALARRPTRAQATPAQLVSDAAVLGAAVRDLEDLTRERQDEEWTDVLAARALTPLRVVASYAAVHRVAQVPARGTPPDSGYLRVRPVWPGRPAIHASGSATAETLGHDVDRAEGSGRAPDPLLGDLRDTLETFTSAAYGRGPRVERSDLDAALASALVAARQIRRRHMWPARTARRLEHALTELRHRAWAH
jgi:hypothetical protein